MKIFTNLTKQLLLTGIVLAASSSFAQKADSTSSFTMTLQQAADYAMTNQLKVQNAMLDEQIARNKVKETRGVGFPQITGNFDVKHFIQIPTSFAPAEFFYQDNVLLTAEQNAAIRKSLKGKYAPLQFGTPYNSSAGFEGSQMLFLADYFIGIQASKVYIELSQKSVSRTKTEVYAAVEKAYYSVLVNEQRSKLLDANLARIGKLKDDTKSIYENGLAEKIDYDRIVLVHNNLMIEKEKIGRYIELSYGLLKYQMGMDANAKLVLTDNLDNIKFDLPEVQIEKFDYSKRIEFSMMESQYRFTEIQLKQNRFAYLPSAFLYGSFSTQASRGELDIFNGKTPWYPVSLVGVKVNVPIFDGFQKHYRIQQSKLSLQKTQNDMNFLKQSIDLELENARIMLLNNASSLDLQKKNMDLAKEVYDVTKTKFEQGIGSNLEVVTAETSLKEAQTNYFSALYDALIAKVDFEKASGKLSK